MICDNMISRSEEYEDDYEDDYEGEDCGEDGYCTYSEVTSNLAMVLTTLLAILPATVLAPVLALR